MIRVLLAVLRDLWNFAIGRENDVASPRPDFVEKPAVTTTEKTYTNSLLTGGETTERSAFVSVFRADCYINEKPAFDELLSEMRFGDTVAVRRIVGDMAQVHTLHGIGWMSVHKLSDDPNDVQPVLEPGVTYLHDNLEVRKLRMSIHDVALGDYLELPLQSLEYILYQLQLRNISFQWPATRPRVVGAIHQLVRGKPGVIVSVEPHTGSVMEIVSSENQRASLGYVVSVQPDESMTVQTVGRVVEGEFRVESMKKDEWRELRPVFIRFV